MLRFWVIAVAFGQEPRHTPVIIILTEKGLASECCLLELTILADANFPIKFKKECLLGEVYWVCQIDTRIMSMQLDNKGSNKWDVYLAPERQNKPLNTALFLQYVLSPFKTFLPVPRTIKTLKKEIGFYISHATKASEIHVYIVVLWGNFKFYFAN